MNKNLLDAWGQILLNRMLRKNGIREDSITVIDRLALVGKTGLGALEYEPDYDFETIQDSKDLDYLAEQCRLVLEMEDIGDLDLLYKMGGSSGSARPKVMTKINQKDWIIKFPSNIDRKNIGEMEYDYAKFSFLYHDEEDRWRLSPAYDLTYSNTYYGEHTTSVDGNGANPGEKELLQVGLKAGMKKSVCTDIIEQIRDMVQNDLQK